jgi:hypothetical protein
VIAALPNAESDSLRAFLDVEIPTKILSIVIGINEPDQQGDQVSNIV